MTAKEVKEFNRNFKQRLKDEIDSKPFEERLAYFVEREAFIIHLGSSHYRIRKFRKAYNDFRKYVEDSLASPNNLFSKNTIDNVYYDLTQLKAYGERGCSSGFGSSVVESLLHQILTTIKNDKESVL